MTETCVVAMCNDGGIVKNIETSRKPAAKHPKSKDEGSTTILYGVGVSASKRNKSYD